MLIYKIFRHSEWQAFRNAGETQGAPVDISDGFIHFSNADQVSETAAKHFAGETELTLLAFDAASLGEALKWEPSRGGRLFPHLFRPLRLEDVLWETPLPLLDGRHVFPEEISGFVDPERAQFDAFKAQSRDHPIEMLNLVRLRAQAAYPEGHDLARAELTGADAYGRYGEDTAPILARLGGSIVWRGEFEATLIGPARERWDRIFVARYPSARAFLAMIADSDYRQAVVHRQAAVRTSRLIRTAPAVAGAAFG